MKRIIKYLVFVMLLFCCSKNQVQSKPTIAEPAVDHAAVILADQGICQKNEQVYRFTTTLKQTFGLQFMDFASHMQFNQHQQVLVFNNHQHAYDLLVAHLNAQYNLAKFFAVADAISNYHLFYANQLAKHNLLTPYWQPYSCSSYFVEDLLTTRSFSSEPSCYAISTNLPQTLKKLIYKLNL